MCISLAKYQFKLNKLLIDGKELYDDIDLTLPEFGITLLHGKSGCGKTTLINNLFNLNRDVFALVSQENDLIIDEISVYDNIRMGQSVDHSAVLDILKKLKMDYILERNSKHLSGGERRIVQILRGYFSKRDIMLLDEPTNNLDRDKVVKIKELLVLLAVDKSIFIVTHDDRMNEIASLIYSIENFKVIADKEVAGKILNLNKMPLNDTSFLSKVIKPQKLSLVIRCVFIVVFLLSLLYLSTIGGKFVKAIPDNQVDVCSSLYASGSYLVKHGYLPTTLYSDKQDETACKSAEEVVRKTSGLLMNDYSLNLKIPPSKHYQFFELVMFDLENSKKYNVFADYIKVGEECRAGSGSDCKKLSIPAKLVDGLDEINKVFNFETAKLRKLSKNIQAKISKDNMQVIYYSLLYDKSVSFEEIIKDKSFEEIRDANYFVRSNQTIAMYNNALFMKHFKNVMTIIVLSALVYIGVIISDLRYDLKLAKKAVISLRNVGYDDQKVKKRLDKCCWWMRLDIVLNIVLFMSNYLLVNFLGLNGVLLYSVFYIYFISTTLTSYISKKMINRYVYKIFSFGGLYDKL